MIQATERFSQVIAADSRRWDARLYVKNNGSWAWLVSADVKQVEIKKGARSGDEFSIGSQFIPTMRVMVKSLDSSLVGKEIQFRISPRDGDTSWREYVAISTGIVTEENVTTDAVEIVAVGYLTANEWDYSTQEIATTPLAELQRVAAKIGTTVRLLDGSELDGFQTMDMFYALEGLKTRDFFRAVAGYIGGFVSEDAEGQIIFGFSKTTGSVRLMNSTMQAAPIIRSTLKATAFFVTVTDSSGEEGQQFAAGEGTPVFNYGTPYMDDDLFFQIKSRILGYEFVSFTAEQTLGNPLMEPWDSFQLDEGSIVTLPEITVKFDGGVSLSFYSVFAGNASLAGLSVGPLQRQVEGIKEKTKELNYFWTDSQGAHVTKVTKGEFLENPTGGNTLTDEQGLHVRDGEEDVAKFTGTGAQIGKDDAPRVKLDESTFQIINADDDTDFLVSRTGVVGVFQSKTVKQQINITTGMEPSLSIPLDPKADEQYGTVAVEFYGKNMTRWRSEDLHINTSYHFNDAMLGTGEVYVWDDSVDVFLRTKGTGTITKTVVEWYGQGKAPVLEFGESSATGPYSVAFGRGTTATGNNQMAVGQYNDSFEKENVVFMVGTGADGNQQNGLEVYNDGFTGFPQGIRDLFAVTTEEVYIDEIAAYSQSPIESQELTPPNGDGYVAVGVVGLDYGGVRIVPIQYRVTKSLRAGEIEQNVHLRFANVTGTRSNATTCTCTILWLRGDGIS